MRVSRGPSLPQNELLDSGNILKTGALLASDAVRRIAMVSSMWTRMS